MRGYRPASKLRSIGGGTKTNTAVAVRPVEVPGAVKHTRYRVADPAAGSNREKIGAAILVVSVIAE